MKKILLLGAFALFGNAYASNTSPSQFNENNKKELKKDQISYHLNLGDITEMTEEEVESKINKFISLNIAKNANAELECKVSVEGSVKIPGGVAEVKITVEVSGPCSEIAKAGKAIAAQILEEVRDALT